ncbi:MAG: sigma-70 family RNA polymerase sigma factor [Chthonomonas sp.]|nr:sigma-70 family RNA polymerase sigma factor [Chthonomonas sp.]
MAARPPSRDALCKLVRTELARLYRVAFRLTGSSVRAEDLVGTTLHAAAKAWDHFDGAHPSAWLLRIMTNANFRQGSIEARHRHAHLDSISEEASPHAVDEIVMHRLATSEVLAGLLQLNPDQQMVIILCDIEEMSYDEVALALEIPRGTVCSRLYRARRALIDLCTFSMEAN